MYCFNDLPRFGGGGSRPSINDVNPRDSIIYIAEVVSIDDENDSGRIWAKIPNIDNKWATRLANADSLESKALIRNEIAAIPLLAKHVNIFPAVGESVFIFIQNHDRKHAERFWVGPLISQPQYLPLDDTIKNKSNLKAGGLAAPDTSPRFVPAAKGVFPRKHEISVQGRYNSDLIFRRNEVVLRAGQFQLEKPKGSTIPIFNTKQAYFKLNYDVPIGKANSSERGSVATMVADKLLFLTYTGKQNDFSEYKLTDGGNTNDAKGFELTEKTMAEILAKAEPAVYGNILLNYLLRINEFVERHTHPYVALPPDKDESVCNVLNYDLNTLLAQNIRLV